jgi:hexulose-6-phosphate isomerase
MKRREFLRSAALGAAVLGSDLALPSFQDSRPRFKKALKYGMIHGKIPVLEKFRLAKAAGFDGVEMDSPHDLKVEEVLAARDATGLEIPGVVDSVHWNKTLGDPDPKVRAEGRAALETAIRDCKQYGGTSVLLVPAVVNKSISYADAWNRSIEEISRVLPLAEAMRVTIAFENVWNHFLLSPLEAARYVDEFKSPWVGWHFDPGNVVTYGWPDQWIRILGKRIKKLDVKEFSRKKRDEQGLWKGFDVEIGDAAGDCDWPAVRKALADVGYSGWAAAEVGGGGAERLKDVAARMDRVLNG